MTTALAPAFDDDRARYLKEWARQMLESADVDAIIESLHGLATHRTEFESFMENMWCENLQRGDREFRELGFWLTYTDIIPTATKEAIFDRYWPPDVDTLAALSLLKTMEPEERRRLLVDILVSVRRDAQLANANPRDAL